MVDNTGNTFGVAPDKGTLDKPITTPEQQFRLMQASNDSSGNEQHDKRQDGGYWYRDIKHGDMPFAPDGYMMFRDVVRDFGAVGDGVTDDTVAINRATSWLSDVNDEERCGEECGQTTRLGAVVYFPTGIYLISSPIIQYYFTQFVGDANARPTIRGSENFTGIALIDCDPYIPGANGANWYINQNQFFRQIRNFIFDMTLMPWWAQDGDQWYAPTGIHWQVSQAASLQNLDFLMPLSDERGSTNATGIFMENGSGGFLSDLYFRGGGIGFRAGSQQYTARNLRFELSLTAISMIWDWGFTWQNIEVTACWVAIECKNLGGLHNQGAGSITVLDSHFYSVPYPIVLRNGGPYPSIVLDNVLVELSASVVLVDGAETILPGSQDPIYFNTWGMGKRYTSLDGDGEQVTGFIEPAVQKPPSLLDGSGNVFSRTKPQYNNLSPGSFIVATDHGISNMADGDQADAINAMLADNVGTPIFFPSGVYLVEKTVEVPVGSIIVGELWPQIMGTGDFFADENSPAVMIRVGNPGDSGIVEISDMLFSVKGPTRGAILMEWNVHESTQGSAAMWDSHFRVGGGYGSDLTIEECPKSTTSSPDRDCMAALLLFHVTAFASGYFENVWVWTADHDMDVPVPGGTETTTDSQINIYTARGTLIESEGPCWFYGTGSEHHQLYQYQLLNARNIFMTHIQTETPYYQPTPDALAPYDIGSFSGDPTFSDCESESSCAMAWAVRVISSRDILIYSAGMYSFFRSYGQTCLVDENCQDRMVETSYTEGLWFYNIFTKGVVEMITPRGGIPPLLQSDDNQYGYTTEVSAWLALALDGGDLGGDGGSQRDGSGVAYIDSIIFLSPSPTVQCWAPCTLVMPPSTLASPTMLSFEPVETSLVVGGSTITEIVVPTVTVTVISFYNVVIQTQTTSTFALESSIDVPPITVTGGSGVTSIITLPAFSTASSTSFIDVTTLPTTETEIDGTLWTFSMDQFTDLATISATTTVNTTLRDEGSYTSTSSSTTDTLFPIWVQIGGFYWSPVYPPGPTPAPPVPPRLPDFPPIPDPPCFRLFGIFSIFCPPDKSQPTTHFTTGPVKPTCTAGCGSLDNENDDDPDNEESSTSTCRTATSTNCYTRSDSTVCNTYIGCACQTRTVTDVWVSCDDQSCRTTSTAEVTGCYVSASRTTVGEYCPTPSAVNPDNYDDGSDDAGNGEGDNLGVVVTTNYPPTIVISRTPYPVPTGSSVVIDGTTIVASPGAGVTSTTLGDGTVVTVIPAHDGPSFSPTQPGVTIPPPSTTADPPWTTGEPDPDPDPDPTVWQGVYINFEYIVASSTLTGGPRENASSSLERRQAVGAHWNWMEVENGAGLELCSASPVYWEFDFDTGLNNLGWPPSMSADVDVWGHSGCRYIGNEDGAGDFECDDVERFACQVDSQSNEEFECNEDFPFLLRTFVPRVRCWIAA
ncbi:pectate lyase superfamily protein-domain-containing protein [Camillea tinctor]|nr:pectate lyase superfamily protein-domain-containing protein [Camillea tinctor]